MRGPIGVWGAYSADSYYYAFRVPFTETGSGRLLKRILLVKTSSLGDIVHNFPVVCDIRRQCPDAAIDWVVEEAFAPLVSLHPGIRRVLPVAVRRWRRSPLARSTWREIGECRIGLAKEHYDAVVDTQGLVKSALISRMARGSRHGFDASSARESLAARFYDIGHHVARRQHAVARNRELVARALGHRLDPIVDFGFEAVARGGGGKPRVVMLHATSRADKLWPEHLWIELGRALEQDGMSCVLPWGSDSERSRSVRIGAAMSHAEVPERLDIPGVARLLAGARAVVGVDTGLVHLAAALGAGVVALFLGTDPLLTGVYGAQRAVNLGGIGEIPSVDAVLAALRSF